MIRLYPSVPDGIYPANDFPDRGEIRGDAVVRLGTSVGHAEAGNDFVHDQQDTVGCG